MTATYASKGALSDQGLGTTISAAYPAGTAAGDLLVMVVMYRENTSVSTPLGFTAPANNNFTSTNSGASPDSGAVSIWVFTRIADGSETGSVSCTGDESTATQAQMYRFTKAAGETWDVAVCGGTDLTADASFVIAGAVDPGLQTDDQVLGVFGLNTDTPTGYSSDSFTATGATIGAPTGVQAFNGSAKGPDSSFWSTRATVTAGTSSAAPSYAATLTGSAPGSMEGAGCIVRIRAAAGGGGGTPADTAGVPAVVTAPGKVGAIAAAAAIAGALAAVTVAAPAGAVSAAASVAGVPAAVTATAPAGGISAAASIPGVPAAVTVTAPAGTVGAGSAANTAGVPAAVTVTAPAGAVSIPADVAGVPAAVTATAPVGELATGTNLAGAPAAVIATAAPGEASAAAATAGTPAAVTATAVPGVASIAVDYVVHRPTTGSVARPASGTVTRPRTYA